MIIFKSLCGAPVPVLKVGTNIVALVFDAVSSIKCYAQLSPTYITGQPVIGTRLHNWVGGARLCEYACLNYTSRGGRHVISVHTIV